VIKTVMRYGDGAGAKRHSAARSVVHSVHGLTGCPIGRLRSNRLRYFTGPFADEVSQAVGSQ
jgi:hypothetical protein